MRTCSTHEVWPLFRDFELDSAVRSGVGTSEAVRSGVGTSEAAGVGTSKAVQSGVGTSRDSVIRCWYMYQ